MVISVNIEQNIVTLKQQVPYCVDKHVPQMNEKLR